MRIQRRTLTTAVGLLLLGLAPRLSLGEPRPRPSRGSQTLSPGSRVAARGAREARPTLPPDRRRVATFPYDKYADMMVNYSVGGVRQGELCVIKVGHLTLRQESVKRYGALLERGYLVDLVIRPKRIDQLFRATAAGEGFLALERELGARYHHDLVLREGASGSSPELAELASREAKPGERVRLTILSNATDGLAEEIGARVLRAGGVPYLLAGSSQLGGVKVGCAKQAEQVAFDELQPLLFNRMTKLFQVRNPYAPRSARAAGEAGAWVTERAARLSPEERAARQQLARQSGQALSEIFMGRMRRIEKEPDHEPKDGFFRTLGISPTRMVARDARLSLRDFGTFCEKIIHLDEPDVPAFYGRMDKLLGHYAGQLHKFSRLRVSREDGKTDLTFSIRDRGAKESRYVAPSTGTGNAMPAEVFTTPVETSANGRLYLDYPFYVTDPLTQKQLVFQGLTLNFQRGRVVSLSVERGPADTLREMVIDRGPGKNTARFVPGFDRLGEFAQSFNRQIAARLGGRPLKDTLIAEKVDMHFALGDGYPVTDGKNRCALHQDIPTSSGPGSGARIEGWAPRAKKPLVIYEQGKFTDAFLDYRSDFGWREIPLDISQL